MKKDTILIITIILLILAISTILLADYFKENEITFQIDDIVTNGKNDVVSIKSDNNYTYHFSTSNDNLASFIKESVTGKNITNNLVFKEKGSLTIKVDVYKSEKLVKTLTKEIYLCNNLKNELNLKDSYDIYQKETIVLFQDYDIKCVNNINLKAANEEIIKVTDNKVTSLNTGESELIIETPKEKFITNIIVHKEKSIKVKSITIKEKDLKLNIGENKTLKATISPSNATNKSIVWTSSNQNVAIVSSNGVVTGKGIGNATIKATTVDGGKSASINVTVGNKTINVESISLSPASVSIQVGASKSLSAIIKPDNATNKSIVWTSSNQDVATVNNGVVTANGIGTAIITVTTTDGSKSAKANVTVTEPLDRLHSIDIKSAGNAILLESNGKYAMIDAGSNPSKSNCTNNILAYLNKLGIKELEFIIVTHVHYDHVYCLSGYTETSTNGFLLNSEIKIKKIIIKPYIGNTAKDRTYYSRIINTANTQKIPISYFSTDTTLELGNFKLNLYNSAQRLAGTTGLTENANSIVTVLSITKGSRKMLSYLAADIQNVSGINAEDKVASQITQAMNQPVFDLYVAAHHGYNSCNKETAIGSGKNKVQFKNAIITNSMSWFCGTYCGTNNNCPYNGETATAIYNIYQNLKRNGGNNNIYFSGYKSVIVNYKSNGITITGGEILPCSSSACSSGPVIYNLIRSKLLSENKACSR